jgi:predicted NAD/FAD-binding protein
MQLEKNMTTTRTVMLRDLGERIEYIRNASTSHSDERLDPREVQAWIVGLTAETSDLDVSRSLAMAEMASGTDSQWGSCVELWALESEAL